MVTMKFPFLQPGRVSSSDRTQRARRWFFVLLILLVGSTPGYETGGVTLAAEGTEATNTADNETVNPGQIEFFEKQVRPILVEHCYECHSEEADGGLRLTTRQGLRNGGDSGPALVPGAPDSSLLVEAIRYRNPDFQMPPTGRLDQSLIDTLEKWIAMGAPDPRAETVTSRAPVGMSTEEGREFWSFRPLASPVVPDLSDQDFVRTPIDAFILQSLNERGIHPAPPAQSRVLIRRLYMNLIGLPPKPEEVERYLADRSPQATRKLIDRLLNSPQYGERWGRHWLDVARYADSNGLDENLAFGNAWRYRDYVVDAFNHDKPFNRFVIEQIAGDLLPDATRETRIATGFLVLGAKVLAEPDREKLNMDTIDEQIDATGKVFMGMSLGCVRCHDHKFDPIMQRDYYALAAIFKSTKTFGDTNTGAIKHWHEYVFVSEDELPEFKALDAEIARLKKEASDWKNSAMTVLRTAAHARATEYLVACTEFSQSDSLVRIAEVAAKYDLHPRILHHCRRHLEFNAEHEVFQFWHEVQQGLTDSQQRRHAVESLYRPLFESATAGESKPVADSQAPTESSTPALAEPAFVLPDVKLVAQALNDQSGFLAVPPKPEFAFDPETLAEYNRRMEAARLFETTARDVPSAMGVTDDTVHPRLPIHIRGSHLNFGEEVAREFPEVMRNSDVRPTFPNHQSGRLELARWMANTQHPLTARVFVNRVWRWHFGEGLVRTTENFGVLGDRPSHPELLDWLTRWFMASGWSTKELHRLILRSSVYQMSANHPAASAGSEIDPENRLLWHFHMQRMEPEQIRDAILAISGRLEMTMSGKTVPLRNQQFVFNHTSVDHTRYDSLRRAVYLPVIRNNLYTMFEQFDFPDPTMPTGNRSATVVAPQALLLMNADLVIDSAESLAQILLELSASDTSRIETAYLRVLGRTPTDRESRRVLAFIEQTALGARMNSGILDGDRIKQGWSLFCQSLFASNEFMYLR
ncbi:MAG: PSD1 and planctomycete cytochrome C domain-containing protein [Rubripirellula sp.]|nr:PSD1 and planctomycete cytochrome C domain-containing protein [Rubripirellula sp.]